MYKAQEQFLGILMLDTNFPRPLGDIGNDATFPFPVRKKIIRGAFPDEVVLKDPSVLLPAFIEAAKKLETEGAKLITTSCGFLTLFQEELEKAVDIPVITSSLFSWQNLRKIHGHVGILTISKSSLDNAHLNAANIPENAPIGSTESGEHFSSSILSNSRVLDLERAEKENVEAATALLTAHPDIKAILLECTNMPPYADAIRRATGLPVFSINDEIVQKWNG